MNKSLLIFICFISVILNAQQNLSKLRLELPNETSCRKIEEKLYINALLNKSLNSSKYVDSIKYCMGASSDLFLVIGRYFYNNEEYKNSIAEFKKVIKLPTSNQKQLAEAFYYLGLASYYTDQNDSSYKYSKRALELGFNKSWTYNNIGLAISEIGSRSEALKYFNESLKANLSNDVAASNIAWIYEKGHNDKEALKYNLYADSILQGNKATYKSSIISNLMELQRDDEALVLAEMAYKRFPNEKCIIEDYSKVLYKQQKYIEMLPLARKLLRMHPTSAREWFSIAYIYDTAGQMDSAFYFYNLCLKYDPKMAVAYDNIGSIYAILGLFKKAHYYVDKALSLDSNYHNFYSRKADIYTWEHDYENAYLWSLKCKERFPQRKGYEFWIGYSLQQLKRYSEAIPFFKIVLADTPEDDRLLNNIGRCYAELSQKDSALIYFQNALKINPENSYIYHNRAALYYDINKYDLACKDLKQAIDKEYNWIIDDKLIDMQKKYCPEVNINVKVLIHNYKGNVQNLSKYNFIQLSDSLLNKLIEITVRENDDAKIQNEENRTISSFNTYNFYPNPSNGVFNIESQTKIIEDLTVKIYNEEGKLVLAENIFKEDKKSFDLKNAPAGIYVAIISNKSSILSTRKIIVAK